MEVEKLDGYVRVATHKQWFRKWVHCDITLVASPEQGFSKLFVEPRKDDSLSKAPFEERVIELAHERFQVSPICQRYSLSKKSSGMFFIRIVALHTDARFDKIIPMMDTPVVGSSRETDLIPCDTVIKIGSTNEEKLVHFARALGNSLLDSQYRPRMNTHYSTLNGTAGTLKNYSTMMMNTTTKNSSSIVFASGCTVQG